jgi:hypothetical protein
LARTHWNDSVHVGQPSPTFDYSSQQSFFGDPIAGQTRLYELEERGYFLRHPDLVALFQGDWKSCGLSDVAWLRDAGLAFRIAVQTVLEGSASTAAALTFPFGRRISYFLAARSPQPVAGMLPFSVVTAEVPRGASAAELRSALTSSPLATAGALLASGALRTLKARMDPGAVNGAPLLGLNGVVVKSHGGADAAGYASAVRVAINLARSDFAAEIDRSVKRLSEARRAVAAGAEPEA